MDIIDTQNPDSDIRNQDLLDELLPPLNLDEMRPIIPLVVEGDEASNNCEIWIPKDYKKKENKSAQIGKKEQL